MNQRKQVLDSLKQELRSRTGMRPAAEFPARIRSRAGANREHEGTRAPPGREECCVRATTFRERCEFTSVLSSISDTLQVERVQHGAGRPGPETAGSWQRGGS